MYSTCIFCNAHLGSNEVFEVFPVGQRLAFDARKGRLWVVCKRCERWNLTPLEERWEVVEQAERRFRDTRRRVSTDNIGLARLADGTELVRIGEPQRPEFAAWRYGDQFGRRRRRQLALTGLGVSALAGAVASGVVAGVGIMMFGGAIGNAFNTIVRGRATKVVATIRTETAGSIIVRRRDLAESRIVRGREAALALDVRSKRGEAHFEGREALRIGAVLMPHVNRYGGSSRLIQAAVTAIDSVGGAEGYFAHLSKHAATATFVPSRFLSGQPKASQSPWSGAYTSGLFGLAPPDRLALEMALHEEAELRAMRGELAELERAWRDAEEIAGISDDMFLPSSIEAALQDLRDR